MLTQPLQRLIDFKREFFGDWSSSVLSVIIYDVKYIINRMTMLRISLNVTGGFAKA